MYFCVAPTAAPVTNHPNKLVSSSPNKTPAVKPAAPPTKGFTVADNKYLTAKSTAVSCSFSFSKILPLRFATSSAYFLIFGTCDLYISALTDSKFLFA